MFGRKIENNLIRKVLPRLICHWRWLKESGRKTFKCFRTKTTNRKLAKSVFGTMKPASTLSVLE